MTCDEFATRAKRELRKDKCIPKLELRNEGNAARMTKVGRPTHAVGVENTNQDAGTAMGRNFISWLGVFAAAGVGLQSAHAGDRKAMTARHAEASNNNVVFAATARSPGDDHSGRSMLKVQGHSDLPFYSVSPFETRLPHSGTKASTVGDEQKPGGPTTPRERKSITFFRFDSKVGAVSVQPVIGGVNGAQLSVGF